MPKINRFQPSWVSAPGETIMDLLEERDVSSLRFAELIGYGYQDTERLIRGEIEITPDLALVLSRVLGAPASFWVAREIQYRRDLLGSSESSVFAHSRWLSNFPLKEMMSFGWIEPASTVEDKFLACLRFFGVSNVKEWNHWSENLFKSVAFKQSPSFISQVGAVAAWLKQAEIKAASVHCNPWNPALFKRALSSIRRLTRKRNPIQFLPELEAQCAECGVAVVILRTPKGCHVSGATRFLSRDKAVLVLSFRYLADDHFWFSFFHEAGHLLLHQKNSVFLEGWGQDAPSQLEHEADQFASNTLIAEDHVADLMKLRPRYEEVMRFAVRIGVSSGVVVGQLQHRGLIGYQQLNRLKKRFVWH